ncbi:uncharacterized protein F5Z01DRAFT_326402 [Emericellopsis atlantica]|uniref:FAD dependent oxidoreductase domain-containing protein n=1 Tax=Emericellopsis atlantica TaxID=2614577 RepID=A0A9P8CSW9_9HYPO|nr:uncharacterized protein F5Z01DRAFT_326402 [Emericellopsis atlantica]KAG9258238.1 hypothetical protein F5Z01DRAFT_326402 [Emericellopsis atlantica]
MNETIVVLGAGVSGLTSALLLSRDKRNTITVVAKHMPGDLDGEYASPFAGANVMPMATSDESQWERETWAELKRLCQEVPASGIHFQKCQVHRRNKDISMNSDVPKGPFDTNPWFKDMFDDFRELPQDKVLPGCDGASEFTSVCINTAIYLPWLVGQLLENGVQLKRGVVSDIREAKRLSHTGRPATLIINATGLGSYKLGGVKDTNMYPARGQVIVVRNEVDSMLFVSGTEDGANEAVYAMNRAAGGGAILGGTFEAGTWDTQPDPTTALRIMSRIVKVRPDIAGGEGVAGLSVVRHAAGLRPYRHGGARVEAEKMDDMTTVVHNYGHGGWGYQGSYGCAKSVVEIVDKVREGRTRAKL